MKSLFLFFGLILMFSKCTTPLQTERSQGFQESDTYSEPDYLSKSLFSSKESTISEADIQKILGSEIKMPDTIRLAILNYSSNSINRYYRYYWSDEEFLKLQQSYIDVIEEKLAGNNKIERISLMPKLMTGNDPDIFQLREAAVRLQADLLFIFSVNSDIYYKYKTFKKDEAKAFATCEALLMDIRTGIIPYSDVVSRDNLVKKIPEDLNDSDTRKRAEKGAIMNTLEEIANGLDAFLKKQ